MKNIFSTFTTIQKQFIAILIALSITGVAGSLYYLKSTNNLKDLRLNNIAAEQKAEDGTVEIVKAVDDIKNQLNQADPQSLIFEEVNLADLRIYPPQWVANRFSQEQRNNALISGPDADPDSDGLPNRIELINGSNPLSAYTLCGESFVGQLGCNKNDKQMLDEGYNPLTGLKLEEDGKFNIKKVDKSIIPSLQDSFANAEAEGVTFTELYEKARTIDLSPEYKKTKVTIVKSNRESILAYLDDRFQSVKGVDANDELTTFTNIYKLVDIKKIIELENYYKDILLKLEPLPTPNIYANFQRGSIMLVKKILRIIELRKQNIESANKNTEQFKSDNKKAALELFWSYRRINDDQGIIEQIIAKGDAAIAVSEAENISQNP
jgi:hypothetical protein